ncbi:uncharacterized protein [Eurosta solidaginis]|uniref:uncharacterized protein n=1 Tax=Eurosta solidaginis TaxID=178769 RepID=UPI003530B121
MRGSETQRKREGAWTSKLDDLFDIASTNALDLIKNSEDKLFLENQRKKGRPGFMYGIDYKTAVSEERMEERQQDHLKRIEQSVSALAASTKLSSCSSESDISEIAASYEVSGAEAVIPTPAKKMRGFKNTMTPKLAAGFDVCKVSDRKAVHLIISVVEAVGLEEQNYIINETSIHNAKEKIRAEQFKNIMECFNKNELGAICLHWDGKLLPALTRNEKVDRLPIIISCGRMEQLLEVPALKSGTGIFLYRIIGCHRPLNKV